MSDDGQAVVEDADYIPVSSGTYKAADVSGKVTVAGSSSVTPVMTKLKEAYEKINTNVTVDVQQSDSTTGVTSAVQGICDIGMASRELKDSETSQGVEATVIAMDGIAVIVNKENTIEDLTLDQIRQIYVGEVTSWDELNK
ncbi:substrate-binding domain-containing protein [Ruminococcus sp.]|uniref:substrate-binding domain-containing protein n=1 Tax=Ruminococcus sp. TaxID=41978 RepID=UPI00300F3F40